MGALVCFGERRSDDGGFAAGPGASWGVSFGPQPGSIAAATARAARADKLASREGMLWLGLRDCIGVVSIESVWACFEKKDSKIGIFGYALFTSSNAVGDRKLRAL